MHSPLKVTILGASGFIGRHLAPHLRRRGDTVIEGTLYDAEAAAQACTRADVVVNLAGAPVAARWTAAYKDEIRRSRVDLPRRLLENLARLPDGTRPKAYISASAIGYYGSSPTATFTEASAPANDWLAGLCVAWEHEALRAAAHGMRVAVVRTGIVLGPDGGVLGALLPIFRLGAGGRLASGRQWTSWIHIDDVVGIYALAIDGAQGLLNATAPHPVTNARFTSALARAVRRPAVLALPECALKLAVGEGALMMIEGQQVLPVRTLELGYAFKFPQIDTAMQSAVRAR